MQSCDRGKGHGECGSGASLGRQLYDQLLDFIICAVSSPNCDPRDIGFSYAPVDEQAVRCPLGRAAFKAAL